MASEPTKTCSKCGNEWLLDAFSPDVRNEDGLRYQCKPCTNEQTKKYQAKRKAEDPEAWRARVRANVRAHRERTGNVYQKTVYGPARSAAIQRLIDAHGDEYGEYLREELNQRQQVC